MLKKMRVVLLKETDYDAVACLQNVLKASENRSTNCGSHKSPSKRRLEKVIKNTCWKKKYIPIQCNLDFKDHVILSKNKNGLHMEKLKSYANCLLKLQTQSVDKPLVRQKRTQFKCEVFQDSEIFNGRGFKKHTKFYHLKHMNDGLVCKTSDKLFKCNSAHAKYLRNKLRRTKKLYSVKDANLLMNVSRKLKKTNWIRTMNITNIKCELYVERKDFRHMIQYIKYLVNNHEIQNHFISSSTNQQKLLALK